jgi:hypothetical protein
MLSKKKCYVVLPYLLVLSIFPPFCSTLCVPDLPASAGENTTDVGHLLNSDHSVEEVDIGEYGDERYAGKDAVFSDRNGVEREKREMTEEEDEGKKYVGKALMKSFKGELECDSGNCILL